MEADKTLFKLMEKTVEHKAITHNGDPFMMSNSLP